MGHQVPLSCPTSLANTPYTMAAVSHNQDALADKFDVKELSGAAQADANERNSTVWEAWRTHKKAVLWSMALSGA